MKKSDTEQEQPGLEENKVSDSQSKRELDRELQELAEKEHQEEIYYEERRRERHERNLKRKKRQIRNRNLALIITALAVLGGVGYFYREQTGLKDGMETLVAKVRDLVPDKNSGKESKAAEELAKADQSTENPESTEPPESTEKPDINTEEAADSSDSTDIQPESGEGTADDSDEMTGNTADNSENTAQGESGNVSDEEKTEDNSSDSVNQPEQEAAQAAAIDLNGVMPQAAAAGAGIIRRQIRHEKKVLTTAKEKAAQYDYDGAISLLQKDNAYVRNVHFQNAAEKFQKKKDKCVAWSPEQVTHIFYHSLIVDTSKAFDGDYKTDGYNQVMTTMDEFNKITQIMYDEGYVMVNLYDLADVDENGKMQAKQVYLPKGKTPFVLSQDDVCYYHSQDGDGIATKLVIDEEGKVRNEYVQDDGSTVVGDYDVVPLIDRFVEEHPDFAYHGHKGIVALTGYNGILGYRTDISYQTRPDDLNDDKKAWLDAHPDFDLDTERAEAKKVADVMKAEGWTFASHTWGHKNMSTVSMERLETDTQNFKENIDPLIGGTDIIIFAFGADINNGGEYTGNEKFEYLKSQGYDYYCNVDSNKYFVQMTDEYFRMGRRNVDGYRMYYNPDMLADLFDVSQVFDPSRPTPVPPMNGG